MDLLMFKPWLSVFGENRFFGSYSWKNKWKSLQTPEKAPWYYFKLHTPQYEEAFPYSSTLLVGLTDGWHMFKLLRNSLLFSALVVFAFSAVWWVALLGYVVHRVGFSFSYNVLFRKW